MLESNEKELVSVLLPVYNGEAYILQLLNSIKRQNYRPVELIISDDNSTDKTVEIIEKWIMKNRNDISIKLLKGRKNIGLSGNFSRMLRHINGEFVFIADQDDIWNYNKVREQVTYLDHNQECIVCICDRAIIDGEGRMLQKSEAAYLKRRKDKMKFEQVICEPSIYAANCMVLRKNHFSDIFIIPKEICEHDTYLATMASFYGKIGFMQKVLLKYRIHNNNLSGSYGLETTKNLITCLRIRMKVNKKIERVKLYDGIIIADMIKKKYNVDIYARNNKLVNNEKHNILVESLKDVVMASMENRINCFYKNKHRN